MKYDLSKHRFFTEWRDPVSGVVSYVLSKKIAPIQQSFYFTNSSMSGDGEWLWFYSACPPSPCRTLGCVSLDPNKAELYSFPNIAFSGNGYFGVSPMVSENGAGVYFCSGSSVYYGERDADPVIICTLDEKYIGRRTLYRLATHLTKSSDGRFFLLDGEVGDVWFLGIGNIRTGQVEILEEFSRNHNHAQFSPINPYTYMIAQDWWFDRITGKRFEIDNRIWIGNIEKRTFYALSPMNRYNYGDFSCHEWWSPDGYICWTDYEKGVFEHNLEKGETKSVWPAPLCHSHCNNDRSFFCADMNPYVWGEKPCSVLFYDRKKKKEILIASDMPLPPFPRGNYHIDPHPQFSTNGEVIVYTTTVRGCVDVAVAPIACMLEKI